VDLMQKNNNDDDEQTTNRHTHKHAHTVKNKH